MLGTAATQLDSDGPTDDVRAEMERYALAARLLDSLLHDARNPLNALSINLEVLAEKLRVQSGGAIPPSQERNLKAMREQVHRIDGILRAFAPHIAQTSAPAEGVDLPELVQRAADVLAHEARRARVRVGVQGSGPAPVNTRDLGMLRFVVTRAILLGIDAVGPGDELAVSVGCERGRAVVRIGAGVPANAQEGARAVARFARQLDAEWSVSGRETRLVFPLA